MAGKTSQLQIRVTEEQKAALRRLAATAKMTVSGYVLSQALPSRHRELERTFAGLSGPPPAQAAALEDLGAVLAETPPDELDDALGSPPLHRLTPLVRNQLAAMVEQSAHAKGVDPPGWVDDVAPLARPHFLWPLSSLRPHQLRVTPVPYKRRGIFFDPASRPALSRGAGPDPAPSTHASEGLRRLSILDVALRKTELKVEFYLLGGAVLAQAFQARPPTAHIDAMFRPAATVAEIAAVLSRQEAWPPGWIQDAVKEHLVGGVRSDRFVELARVAVFVPPLEYALAIEVAALRLGTGARALDDLRYVLRALNLTSAAAALQIVGRYFAPRQVPDDARTTLERLLAA